ncbi:unnamed protein product [Ectocarpus sp. 6 AP-2014]
MSSSVPKKARIATPSNGGYGVTVVSSAANDGKQEKLSLLRAAMQARGVSAYLVETQDAHQSEYVADHDKRREWLTGFTGSAGTALVTHTKALMWTDGRYFLQASQQLSADWMLMRLGEKDVPTLEQWLEQEAATVRDARVSAAAATTTAAAEEKEKEEDPAVPGSKATAVSVAVAPAAADGAGGEKGGVGVGGFRVGVDPWLLSAGMARTLTSKLAASGGSLVPISGNLVDEIWTDQPPVPRRPVRVHPLKFAGVGVPEKIAAVRKLVVKERASSLVVMAMDEVAWLFNIRGSDILYNPVAFAASLLTQEDAFLFIDTVKLGEGVEQHLMEAGVTIKPYDALLPELRTLKPKPSPAAAGTAPAPLLPIDSNNGASASGGSSCDSSGTGRVLMPSSLNLAVREAVPASLVLEKASPIALAKALKNDQELQGLREAHVRDGVALTAFLSWLERAMEAGEAGSGGGVGWPLTECTVAEKLDCFRKEQAGYVSLSFETISGYGPNGAVIHYAAKKETARDLGTDSLFLLDSGAQYTDGTTDVTRTVHFGSPTEHQRRCFTLVLKGHIALARAVFPEDTMGSKLDVLARLALWEAGLDYRHGTGHGVGAFLNVHEGPHGIHCRIRPNEQGIKIGMTTSNEPGYYEDGAFGLRIENVCICVEKKTQHNFAGKRSCTFETITMAPIQTKLIDVSMLTTQEREWLDDYHATVLATLGPLLKDNAEAFAYLVRETRPLEKSC